MAPVVRPRDAGSVGRTPWWSRVPRPAAVVTVAAALGAAYAITHLAGGSHTAVTHVFYVPILLAALPFGTVGAVVTALLAAVAAGPLLPLEVAAERAQPWPFWVARGVAFVVIGALAGSSLRAVRRAHARDLTARFEAEIDRYRPVAPADPMARDRVQRVLDDGLVRPVFQPIYGLPDGELLAVEALARFDHEPPRPPDVWFAEAARVGLGVELEVAAVAAAFAAAVDLPRGIAVSVNSSPAALTDPRFLELVRAQRGRAVVVEVTEHAVVDDYAALATVVGDLRAEGVRLAVDDAGAGFSSLRHIVRLAPEVIKLDTSLSQDVAGDPVRRAMADCLVRFARETGSALVAEGIEDRRDLQSLLELGADAAQGYLLARPGPLPVPARSAVIAELRGARRVGGPVGTRVV